MTERDELAAVIVTAYGEDAEKECPCEQDLEVADAILAAGYRKPQQVTTEEELGALPNGTVVLSRMYHSSVDGVPISFQRWYDGAWYRGARSASTHPDNFLPAVVLHKPEEQ